MFWNLLSASWNSKVSSLPALSAPWKREAVSSGYSIHPQLQRKMPSPCREEMIPLVQRSGFQRLISPVDIGRWSLSQLTARKPPLPLHMGCISSACVMPFGLCNAPGTFQRLMEHVLVGLHWTSCLVYLDDIIIFSQTISDHLQKLREVLARLQKAGLKIKPNKCFLMQQRVQYLCHVVSAKGVETDPKKVSCVSKWPIPTDVKELQQFLGLASYYRRFVKNFAHKARPLYRLTEKGRRWNCTHECGEAFVTLKHALISDPILAFPDFNHDFILDTDASTVSSLRKGRR